MNVEHRPRGRPRKLERGELTARLRQVFARKGFSGASVEHLAQCAGLERASLYHAFGDKRSMYLAAYEQAVALLSGALRQAMNEPDINRALGQFYGLARSFYAPDDGAPTGCFAIGTALTEAAEDPAIRAALQRSILRADDLLEQRFRKAADDGQLDPSVDPAQLAMMANTALHGLAIRVRAGLGSADLDAYIDAALAFLLGRTPGGRKASLEVDRCQ